MTLPRLESRVTVPTGGWDIGVTDSGGSTTITIPAGDYYIQGTTSIYDTFETELNSDGTLNGTYTLTLQTGTGQSGRCNISTSGGGNPAFTWTDTDFRDVLGYTGNLSGSTSYLSTNSSPHVWMPNVGRTEVASPEPSSTAIQIGASEYDYNATRSPSGYTTALTYNERWNDTMTFFNLQARKTWIEHESVANESLQKWMRTLYEGGGTPFKYFPDLSSSSVFWELRFAGIHMQPVPTVPNWVGSDSLWRVSYEVWKK